MKKLLLVLALFMALVVPSGAFAASCAPDTDKWTNDAWCINSQDTLIPTTSAGQQVIYETYTSENTNNVLTIHETGKVITDTGGAAGPTALCNGGSKHILPTASPGLTYTLTVGSRCSVTLDTVDTGDTILYSISSTGLDAGDSIKSTGQAGDSVTVVSTAAHQWSITSMKGSWTDNSTN